MNGRVLVIAPHADDEALGVGGTIAKHISQGDEVAVVVAADRMGLSSAQRTQAKKAKEILGYQSLTFFGLADERVEEDVNLLIELTEEAMRNISPDIIYTCHGGDFNLDHQAVFKASVVACRILQRYPPKRFVSYEVPSSTQQGLSVPFIPNFYNKLSPEDLDAKIQAFAQYKDEVRPLPNPRNEDGLANFAIQRGMDSGTSFAEAFMILREVS